MTFLFVSPRKNPKFVFAEGSFSRAKLNRNDTVAARLRSLRTNDPLNKGHPRSIWQKLETAVILQTYIQTLKLIALLI